MVLLYFSFKHICLFWDLCYINLFDSYVRFLFFVYFFEFSSIEEINKYLNKTLSKWIWEVIFYILVQSSQKFVKNEYLELICCSKGIFEPWIGTHVIIEVTPKPNFYIVLLFMFFCFLFSHMNNHLFTSYIMPNILLLIIL